MEATQGIPTVEVIERLVHRVQETQHGFRDIEHAADDVVSRHPIEDCIKIATALFASEVHQARSLATFIFGKIAAKSKESLTFMKATVSRDKEWRVQEILAKAFDNYCADIGYEKALPVIKEWLGDSNHNVRRAVTEGLRVWTAKGFFKDHPDIAIHLLSQLKDDESGYVRKSVGNALRDISRKHHKLIRAELEGWDTSKRNIRQTHRLASKFLD